MKLKKVIICFLIISACKKSAENQQKDELIGRFYTNSYHPKVALELNPKLEQKHKEAIYYQLDFKGNGEVIFEDLTGFYECGNGVLSIEKGFWRHKKDTIYELIIHGSYLGSYKFHNISEYKMIKRQNGTITMDFLNEITHERLDGN